MPRTVVVIGQGYVGLPLAQAAVHAGFQVWGHDLDDGVVSGLNVGSSHVDDVTDSDVAAMIAAGYRATTEHAVIADADVVTICVPTPLEDGGGPDLAAVTAAARTIAAEMTTGTLVVLESTSYPGTTEDVVLPILTSSGLRHDEDFYVAFSPERVNPGFPEYGMRNTPKLVCGLTRGGTARAVEFYEAFVDQVVVLSGVKEAETAKLLENTYRHVNIALVNEMARFCHDLGIDIWEVIRGASTKPFGFHPFQPGPGVGGHCIPVDPNYLSHRVRTRLGYPFRFVELAQEINSGMPRYVVERVGDLLNERGKSVNGSRVLLLGVTYKPDIADQRESPAVPLARILHAKHAKVEFHDPFVDTLDVDDHTLIGVGDIETAVRDADVVVLLQAHRAYDPDALARTATLFFDTRGVAQGASVVRL
jgi:UDP-N-acetyl-D-glucosamine dehydrogenase